MVIIVVNNELIDVKAIYTTRVSLNLEGHFTFVIFSCKFFLPGVRRPSWGMHCAIAFRGCSYEPG